MLWFDGVLQEGTRAAFDLADRGLTLGDGVFDTALARDGRIVLEDAHIARLVDAAARLGFPLDPAEIREAMRAVAGAHPRAAIRTNATRGAGPRGLAPPAEPRPCLWASAAPLADSFACAPLRLHPTEIRRNDTSPASRLKTLGYLDAVLAAGEARARGFDEALFRNTQGRVACAGTGNVFALFGTRLITPPLSEGVLPGIVRAEILARAGDWGFVPSEQTLMPADLIRAEAVFVTNSLRILSPVRAIGTTAYAAHPATGILAAGLNAAMDG